MNSLAKKVPVGSDQLVNLPFGNGSERMLNNRNFGAHFCNLNLNVHTQAHLCRAALEGIAFAFYYGMEIMKEDGLNARVIRAGNDNLFQSEVMATTLATLIGQPIEIYDTTGAVGAARAAVLEKEDLKELSKNRNSGDKVMEVTPEREGSSYHKAYENWKEIVKQKLKNTI